VSTSESPPSCKRRYDLGKRQEASDRTREAVLSAARAQLETGGVRDLTMESLARASGVTRQTIHNLFGTRRAILEALFDRMAMGAGMMRMREVMMAGSADAMLAAFVDVFTAFWAKDRLLLRRIHGIAAIDPEFGQAIAERNARRKMAATRVIERLDAGRPETRPEEKARKIACLAALTSFEFFDVLAESCGSVETAAGSIYPLTKKAMAGP
jgi:AcrR family transcriptional regulator